MLGFLFAGALGGLAGISWPLYLHLRRRNRQVQSVPSLRLFTVTRQNRKKIRLQQLILMLARCLIISAIFFLVSQPTLRTSVTMPLPLAAGELDAMAVVGILVDDGLTAADGETMGARLELSREWLLRQIDALPATTRYRLITTTCPFVSPLMGNVEAREAIQSYQALPRDGDATLALQRLTDQLSGQTGLILVAAPRANQLWRSLDPVSDLDRKTPVSILDLSNERTACYIRRVEPSHDDQTFKAILAGAPEDIAGRSLVLTQEGRAVSEFEIAPRDILQGEAAFPVPETPRGTVFEIQLVDDKPHLWKSWSFQTGVATQGGGAVVIVRPESPTGYAADKLITATLLATSPDISLIHANSEEPPPELTQRLAAVVCIDTPSPAWEQWLAGSVRTLYIPLAENNRHQLKHPWFPRQVDSADVVPAKVQPLVFTPPTIMPNGGLDELVLSGVDELSINQVVRFQPFANAEVLLETATGQPLIQAIPTGQGSWAIAIGMTLNLGEDSPVFHPVFPFLIQRLLLPEGAGNTATAEALVGQTMALPGWFDRKALQGTLVDPQGQEVAVNCSESRPQYIPVDRLGTYQIRIGDLALTRVANLPRPAGDELVTRADWEAARPLTQTTWLTADDNLSSLDFSDFGGPVDEHERKVYDLSPLAVALLLVAMLMEAVVLLLAWRKRSS